MFVHPTRLPHLLPPAAYFSPEQYARECQTLLNNAWHLVGTTADLGRPGDFISFDLLGHPAVVRNFDGRLAALSNVCAHRHSLITSQPRGCSERFRCQYHGWEYGSDGRTRRIPQAKNFAPFDSDALRLAEYRVATCGQLVFVSLAADGPSLAEHLGNLFGPCAERFGDRWAASLAWQPDAPVNWKIPIENSLESYHVPCIHPDTFREDPGEARSRHVLEPRHTAFNTQLPFSAHSKLDAWFQRAEGWFLRRLGERPTGQYWQHHVFPNLLFSFTDAISLCHCVLPTGPTSSRSVILQFGRRPADGRVTSRLLAAGWGRIAAAVTRRVVEEDLALFPNIQRGLEASTHAGMLGRCEERIHAFQAYVQQSSHGAAAVNEELTAPPCSPPSVDCLPGAVSR